MISTNGSIVIIDLKRVFVKGVEIHNIVSVTVNKSQSISIRVTNIDCKYKEELQALGINVKVV